MSTRKRLDATFDGAMQSGKTEIHVIGSVPSGKTWRLQWFGGGATGKGADESARVTLERRDPGGAWVVMRAMGLSQNAMQLEIGQDLTATELRVVRSNGQGSPKDVTAWITGYEF